MWLLLMSESEKSQLSTLLPFSSSPDKSDPLNLQRCMLEELNLSCRCFNPEKSASTQLPRDISQLGLFIFFPDGGCAASCDFTSAIRSSNDSAGAGPVTSDGSFSEK